MKDILVKLALQDGAPPMTIIYSQVHARLPHGGALERVQESIANESPRPAEIYDRTKERITQDEVKRARLWA